MEKQANRFELDIPSPIRKLLTALIILISLIGAVFLINSLKLEGHDFYTNLWGPSHLLLEGKSPYNLTPLYEAKRAVWLPMGIGTFFPVGALTQSQAINLWLIFNIGIGVGLVFLSSLTKRPAPHLFFVASLAFFIFPGTIRHLVLGQFTLVTIFLVLIAANTLEKYHPISLAFFISLALTKPQIIVLALPGLLLAYRHLQGNLRLIQLIGGILVWSLLLTIPLFLASPDWPKDFLHQLQDNPDWVQPGMFSQFEIKFGDIGVILWGIVALIGMGINLWLWFNLPPEKAVLGSLALTPLVSPYIWSWDFVTLMPFFVWCLISTRTITPRLLLASGYVLCWYGMLQIALSDNYSDSRFWWVSWWIFGVTVTAYWIDQKSQLVSKAFL